MKKSNFYLIMAVIGIGIILYGLYHYFSRERIMNLESYLFGGGVVTMAGIILWSTERIKGKKIGLRLKTCPKCTGLTSEDISEIESKTGITVKRGCIGLCSGRKDRNGEKIYVLKKDGKLIRGENVETLSSQVSQ